MVDPGASDRAESVEPTEPAEVIVGVVVIDDHQMFAESLARLLDDDAQIDVLGVAASAAEGIELAARVRPKVALVDFNMPGQDGAAIASAIKADNPSTMVVVLTGAVDDRALLASIDAGCSGFITKDRAASEVATAVHSAAAGEVLISPALLARLLPQLHSKRNASGGQVTDRELMLLRFMARGWTNKAIANELHLSVNTIRNNVQSLLTKLGAHSKLEAVATAVREGIIEYPMDR